MANIKELLKTSKNATALPVLIASGRLTQKEDMEGYVVGGFVRDILMGNSVNDVDIMVICDGILFAKKLAKELGVNKTIPIEKFGNLTDQYIGRTPYMNPVVIKSRENIIGKILPVKIFSSNGLSLSGGYVI